MNKLKWGILGVLVSGFLVLLGVYIGAEMLEQEEGFSIKEMAVVNLDEGVRYNNENRNFGVELLNISGAQYTLTGLADARSGIEDGRYAGYIIIPTDFSQKVTTINNVPETTNFAFELNKNLRDDARVEAIYNIIEFEKSYNTNLSTMYLTSVLTSFHSGQDGTRRVLQNDLEDLEIILNIRSEDFVSMVELTDVPDIENDITNLDIELQKEKNEELVNTLDDSYKEFILLSAEELENIKTDYTSLNNSLDNIRREISTFTPIEDENGVRNYTLSNTNNYLSDVNNRNRELLMNHNGTIENFLNELQKLMQRDTIDYVSAEYHENKIQKTIYAYLYENPTESYEDAIAHFKAEGTLDEDVKLFMQYLGIQLEDIKPDIEPDTDPDFDPDTDPDIDPDTDQDIDQDIDSDTNQYNEMDNDRENNPDMNPVVNPNSDQAMNSDVDMVDVPQDGQDESTDTDSDDESDSDTDDSDEPTCFTISDYIRYYGDIEATTQRYQAYQNHKNNIDEVLDLGKGLQTHRVLETSMSDISSNVRSDLGSLHSTQLEYIDSLYNSYNIEKSNSDTFHQIISDFNPMSHIDQRVIDSHMRDLLENNRDIEKIVYDRDTDFNTVISNVFDTSLSHILDLREIVQLANEESNEIVENGISEVKSVKSKNSEDNQRVLNDFLATLTNTRNGTLTNTDVVNFITNPMTLEGVFNENNVIPLSISNPLIYSMSILAVLSAILYVSYKVIELKKLKEE